MLWVDGHRSSKFVPAGDFDTRHVNLGVAVLAGLEGDRFDELGQKSRVESLFGRTDCCLRLKTYNVQWLKPYLIQVRHVITLLLRD